jgi:hypothetical protein
VDVKACWDIALAFERVLMRLNATFSRLRGATRKIDAIRRVSGVIVFYPVCLAC